MQRGRLGRVGVQRERCVPVPCPTPCLPAPTHPPRTIGVGRGQLSVGMLEARPRHAVHVMRLLYSRPLQAAQVQLPQLIVGLRGTVRFARAPSCMGGKKCSGQGSGEIKAGATRLEAQAAPDNSGGPAPQIPGGRSPTKNKHAAIEGRCSMVVAAQGHLAPNLQPPPPPRLDIQLPRVVEVQVVLTPAIHQLQGSGGSRERGTGRWVGAAERGNSQPAGAAIAAHITNPHTPHSHPKPHPPSVEWRRRAPGPPSGLCAARARRPRTAATGRRGARWRQASAALRPSSHSA